MGSKFDKMKEIVAKLLRQAEDVAGTPEEEVFHAKAFELMAKYGIEQAEVEAAKAGLDLSQMPDAVRWEEQLTGSYIPQQASLLYSIIRALHGTAVLHKGDTVIAFAVPRHMERIQFLWNILRPQMLRQIKVVRPNTVHERHGYRYDYQNGGYQRYVKSGSGQVRAFRRAWIAGFGAAVGDRICEQETKAVEASTGSALVLYKDDKQRAMLARKEAFPRLGREGRTRYDSNGYAAGQAAGRSASFQAALA